MPIAFLKTQCKQKRFKTNFMECKIKVITQLQMLYSCWLDQAIAPPTIFSLASWFWRWPLPIVHWSILAPSYWDQINTIISLTCGRKKGEEKERKHIFIYFYPNQGLNCEPLALPSELSRPYNWQILWHSQQVYVYFFLLKFSTCLLA